MSPMDSMFRFPKRLRLRHRSEFRLTMDNGLKVADRYLVVLARPVASDSIRIGIIVSKKVGGAVVRNRVKRLLRERFRTTRGALASFEMVVIARNAAATAPAATLFQSYDACLLRLCKRLAVS